MTHTFLFRLESFIQYTALAIVLFGLFSFFSEIARTINYGLPKMLEEGGEVLIGSVIVPLALFFILKKAKHIESSWHRLMLLGIATYVCGVLMWFFLAMVGGGGTLVIILPLIFGILLTIFSYRMILQSKPPTL